MLLILLPGMDGTGRLFEPLRTTPPPSLTVNVVSYPPDEPFGYEELYPFVEAAAASGEEFVVVGESFSGPLALMLASRRSAGLRGVVLCASFVRFPLSVPKRWRGMVRPWMFRLQPLWLLSWVLLGRHAWGPLGRLLRQCVRSVSPVAMAARARSVAEIDVTAELQTCPVPVLYLRATEDRVVRMGCWKLVQSVRPDIELIELPGPHLVLQTSALAAAGILVTFCERVAR